MLRSHDYSKLGSFELARICTRLPVAALSAAGIPTVDLDSYDGTPVAAVKVGTIKRAKGLEFKQVLLCGIRSSLLGSDVPTDPAQLERYEFSRRELYVGMTRARDGLWVGVSS